MKVNKVEEEAYPVMKEREVETPAATSLVKWRSQVLQYAFRECVDWDMEPAVFALTVNMTDRALSYPAIQRVVRDFHEVQQLVFLCFWVAGKVEGEFYLAPQVVLNMIHNRWTLNKLLEGERELVALLGWELHQPLPIYFVWYYSAEAGETEGEKRWLYSTASFMLTCVLMATPVPQVKPSVLAFCCVTAAINYSGLHTPSGHMWEVRGTVGIKRSLHTYKRLAVLSGYKAATYRHLISLVRQHYELVATKAFSATVQRMEKMYDGRFRRTKARVLFPGTP